MATRNSKHDSQMHFEVDAATKRAARKKLARTPFSLADFLRQCLADLAAGKIVVEQTHTYVEPESPR